MNKIDEIKYRIEARYQLVKELIRNEDDLDKTLGLLRDVETYKTVLEIINEVEKDE